jgi:hypothetical protein
MLFFIINFNPKLIDDLIITMLQGNVSKGRGRRETDDVMGWQMCERNETRRREIKRKIQSSQKIRLNKSQMNNHSELS